MSYLFNELNESEQMKIEGGDTFDLGKFVRGFEQGITEIRDAISGFIAGWNSVR